MAKAMVKAIIRLGCQGAINRYSVKAKGSLGDVKAGKSLFEEQKNLVYTSEHSKHSVLHRTSAYVFVPSSFQTSLFPYVHFFVAPFFFFDAISYPITFAVILFLVLSLKGTSTLKKVGFELFELITKSQLLLDKVKE